jgi:predicted regulator of Ras-like GTPase activity (Roadblock/LC7/MglB family)
LAPELSALVDGTVNVRLSALCEFWPDPVRRDIAQFNWENAWLSLPMDRLEPAMKTGKVVFKWGELIEWLEGSSDPVATSHCETTLELPLKVVAPLFLAQQRTPIVQKSVVVDQKVPNLFAAMGKEIAPVPENPPAEPEAAPEPDLWSESEEIVSAPPPIRYAQRAPLSHPAPAAPVVPAPSVVPPAPVAIPPRAITPAPVAPGAPETPADPLDRIFGQPANGEWSPEEITRRINTLPGVSASLIAMSDGFLVAGTLPPPLKSETMAAFLPQIFGRLSNYSGEIQLGPLTALTLRAGPAPVTIFKTGALYLTVLGKPGGTLPDALLHQVAAELAKRN